MLSLLALLATDVRPRLAATRISEAPVLDGKLDDAAWAKARKSSAFTQKFPSEGDAPSERTTLRVLYDDSAVYIAIDCEQIHSQVVQRLTRRGRLVESDWVSVALGARGDGRSAFEFTVNASGVLVDALRYNDIEKADDIEENWEARTALTARGWSAEIRIPLRVLRFSAAAAQSWDFQARRYISERQETEEWALVSRQDAGEVSRYGHLDGLDGLTPSYPLELRPFVLAKFERRDPQAFRLAHGNFFAVSAGLDLKWHAASDLSLEATVNPDFAQVEADQLALNLSNFETFYPEKRPFFSEGTDIFATPVKLLYTRRIGAALPPGYPQLRMASPYEEQLVDTPDPLRIYGASKLTGRIANGWSIGLLQALTAKNAVSVQLADGSRQRRTVAPLAAYQALRLKHDIGESGYVGLMATGTTYAETTGQYPLAPNEGTTAPAQLCPNAVEATSQDRSLSPSLRSGPALAVRPSSRCFNDAYVGSADWQLRFGGNSWVFSGQALASTLRSGAPRHAPDGTVTRPGDVGAGVTAKLTKDAGLHWLGVVEGEYFGPKLELNDLGFQQRVGDYFAHGGVTYRELESFGPFLEANSGVSSWSLRSPHGLNLETVFHADAYAHLKNFWQLSMDVEYHTPYFEDREVGDGTLLQRAGYASDGVWLTTDPTRPVSFELGSQAQLRSNGWGASGDLGMLIRALPALDLEILPTASYTTGEPRFVGTSDVPGQYLFGELTAKALGSTLRATYTFAPRLTLQSYAQLLLASGHYDHFSSFQATGPGSVAHLRDLRRVLGGPTENPDFQEGVLNLSVVLRWEYRLGSTLYLVYTRSQFPDVGPGPGEAAHLSLHALSRAPATDIILLKISNWWG